MIRRWLALLVPILLLAWAPLPALAASEVRDLQLTSRQFDGNKIGISSQRRVSVYLPDGYATSGRRYPVIYFLHNVFENERALYAEHDAQGLFDRAIKAGIIPPVIVVSADFSTPLGGSIYANSPVTGQWRDFMIKELVPWTDAGFRTLATRYSRGLAGDRMGGHGAIAFGMRHPDVFGAVYALHPVGTGLGLQTMSSRPNWDRLQSAKSLDDLKADPFSQLFTAIYQAHLPNPGKPPLYVDLPAHKVDGRLEIDMALTSKLQDGFLLDRSVGRYADNLKTLRGFKFDWGRNDPNADHVVSNQAFSRLLVEYDVPHEAEEYVGGWGDRAWGETGRVYTDLLPFFAKTLVFEGG